MYKISREYIKEFQELDQNGLKYAKMPQNGHLKDGSIEFFFFFFFGDSLISYQESSWKISQNSPQQRGACFEKCFSVVPVTSM